MSTIKGLNYSDMGISVSKQLGSDKEVKDLNKTDYSDGLSQAELQKIDTNGDGVITEKEFKAACKNEGITDKNAKNYWQTLTLFTKATSKSGKNGSSTVSQKDNTGRTIETEFDKAGNVVSKKIIGTDNSTVTTTYNKNGKPTSTKYSNGKEINYEYDSKNKLTKQTLKRTDGTKQVTEYNTYLKFDRENKEFKKETVKNATTVVEYDLNNEIKSTSVTEKLSNGNTQITVYNSNNEISSETTKKKTGQKTVTEYNGNTTTITEYGKKAGQLSKKVNVFEDNKTTLTQYDKNNNFVSQAIHEYFPDNSFKITYENEKHMKTVETDDSNGNVTIQRFDASGKEIELSDTINGLLDENRYQGQTGDCWFIAGLNSLNSTEKGRQVISNSITKNDDGSVTVNFKGVDKSYTVTSEEINSHDTDARGFDAYSNGDNDLLVLEIAYDKIRQDTQGRDIRGGWNEEIYEALTGINTTEFGSSTGKTSASDIDKALNAAMSNKNLALGFALRDNFHTAKQTNGEPYVFEGGNHAFSITNVTKDSVTFVNPWDSAEPVTMTREQFKKLGISALQGCDMKNLNVNNIKPIGMSKKEAKQLFNEWSQEGCYISQNLSGYVLPYKVQLNLFQELKTKLSKGNITDVNKFVNDFASSNKLNASRKEGLKTFVGTMANDNKLELSDVTATFMAFEMLNRASSDGEAGNEDIKTVANLIKSSTNISDIVTGLNNSGLLSKYNETDLTSLMSVFDTNNNNKLSESELNSKAKTFINNSIKDIKERIEEESKYI